MRQLFATLMLAAGALLALAWQARSPLLVDVGALDDLYIQTFHGPEKDPQQITFRWTQQSSTVTMPGVGVGRWQLSLVLAANRPPNTPLPTIELVAGIGSEQSVFAEFTPTNALFDTYYLPQDMPTNPLGDAVLIINTLPAYTPPNDPRELGVALDQVVLRPVGPILPAPWTFAALLGTIGAAILCLSMLGGKKLVIAGGLALSLALAYLVAWQRLWITPFNSYLLLMSVLLAVGVTLAHSLLRRYAPEWGNDAEGQEAEGRRQVGQAGGQTGKLALVALLVVVLGYSLIEFGLGLTFLFQQNRAVDFQAMWKAIGRLNLGMPLYDLDGLRANPFASFYKYPPLFAGLGRPIAWLDFDSARTVWRGLNLCVVLASIGLIITSFTRRPFTQHETTSALTPASETRNFLSTVTAPAALGLLFLTMLFHPVIDALNYGQLDPIILLLLVLTLVALRAGRPILAGPPLALAVMLKLFPVILVAYLAWRREWRALGSFVAALVGWALVGLALTGPDAWRTYFTDVLALSGGSTAWVENQTLAGFVARLFTDQLRLEPFPTDPGQTMLWTVATYAGAAIVLALTLWATRRPASRTSASYALGFSATLSASIFILPAAWLHYLTILLLPLAVAFYTLQQQDGQGLTLAHGVLARAAVRLSDPAAHN